MNKFKKVMLGALSVLTLGLFAVVGARVDAATTYSGSHEYSVNMSDLTASSNISTYGGGKPAGKTQTVDDTILALSGGNFNWYNAAIDSSLSVINNTGHTFTSFAVPTSNRTVTVKVPTGKSKISVELYFIALNKANDNGNYSLYTKNDLTLTFSDGAYENVKFDGVDSTSPITLPGDSTIHTLSFDYTANTSIAIKTGVTIMGYVADSVSTTGYNINYGTDHGTAPTQLTEQTALPTTFPLMSATGYTFGGWYTDSNCTSGNEAVAGASISSNVFLYAKWTINTSEWCTITFDVNGGTCEKSTDTAVFGSSYTLPEATKSGYSFGGWSDGTNNYSGTFTVPSQSTITLTAQWNEMLTFDVSCSFQKDDPKIVSSASGFFTNTVDDGDKFTIQDASGSFNNVDYSVGLKLEGSTKLKFTPVKNGTLYIAMSNASATVSVNGTQKTASNHVVTLAVEADTAITLSRGADQQFILFVGIIYDKLNKNVTAATAAWQNSTRDSLRFVGTISGVSDLSTIDTIELVLLKNDVATKKHIFLTTCFISVSGVGSYTEIDNTYYVVYRITGIDSTSMPDNTVIKHKLIVTFTDGSSVTSNLELSEWIN